jgi:adenine-specific DNA-methyltransferase
MPTLQWIEKDKAILEASRTKYHLLEENKSLSYGNIDSGNIIVQGDNLAVLKSLLPIYQKRVKCIYIDPPYNTQSAFTHYNDSISHSMWLSMIWPRIELLREFLSEDGSIWISIDDSEGHYLKVILDEIFGRSKFVTNIVWQKRYSRENRTTIGEAHEHIMLYAADPDTFKNSRNKLPLEEKQLKVYRNPNNDPRGAWRAVSLSAQGFRPNQMYEIISPTGKRHRPPAGSCWKIIESEYKKILSENKVYFGKDGNAVPSRIQFLKDIEGVVPWTWWTHDEVGHTDEAKREGHCLFGADTAFATPKPERLIARILQIASNPGDLVLDSFLGSGTTAAVAHKMGRRYIGVEMGEHAVTHCVPRLRKVIEGEQGGISEAVGWAGGGGFRFFQLGSSVFEADGSISSNIQFPVLAAHIWFSETETPWAGSDETPFLGVHSERGYALLYNGILGDRRPDGGNVLTRPVLKLLRTTITAATPTFAGPLTIYGERSALSASTLEKEGVTFKQTPYDVKARR